MADTPQEKRSSPKRRTYNKRKTTQKKRRTSLRYKGLCFGWTQ